MTSTPSSVSPSRESAFAVLADKKAMDVSRAKTRMCENTMSGKKCYRKFCNFAHSKSELKVPTCLFGDKCRNIHSDAPKQCIFVHPCEDEVSYQARTGKTWPLNVTVPLPARQIPQTAEEVQQQQQAAIDVVRSKMDEFPSLPHAPKSALSMETAETIIQQFSSMKISWADICEQADKDAATAEPAKEPVKETAKESVAMNYDNDSDDDEGDAVKIILTKPAPTVAAPVTPSPSVPSTPPRITVSLTLEQFAMVYPQLSQMGMAFGFPTQM